MNILLIGKLCKIKNLFIYYNYIYSKNLKLNCKVMYWDCDLVKLRG